MTTFDIYARMVGWWVKHRKANFAQSVALGRWLVSAYLPEGRDDSRVAFWIRTPPDRVIGFYEEAVAFNQIDGYVFKVRWYGDPTDEEITEISLLV